MYHIVYVFLVVIACIILFFTGLLLFFRFIYRSSHSIIFMGETYRQECEIDKTSPIPFSVLIRITMKALTTLTIQQQKKVQMNIHEIIQPLIDDYPEIFFGYMLKGYIYRIEHDEENAKKFYQTASEIFKAHSEENKLFAPIFPTEDQFFGTPWPAELKEIIPGTIWAINCPFKASSEHDPIDLQASVVKTEDGDVLIINPIPFTDFSEGDELIQKINAIGTVAALITPTGEHGRGIEVCASIWPEAKLFGTDRSKKHGKPELAWAGFLKDEDQLFHPDLQHFLMDGQRFSETLFYHKSSKTLLGLTDLGVATHGYNSWAMTLYTVCFGLWRGEYSNPIASQSYQLLQMPSRPDFRESLNKILELPIERAVLGHLGVLDDPVPVIRECYHWVLDPNNDLSVFDKIYLPVAWIIKLGFFSIVLSYLNTIVW